MVTPLTILHDDDDLIAVAKPAGIATANVPAGEESVFTAVREMLARRGPRAKGVQAGEVAAGRDAPGRDAFLGVVSRLDKPVSGVVVLARTRAAAASLAGQFRNRSVGKTYYAIVEGRFPAPLGQWAIWRDAIDRPGSERDRRAGSKRPQSSVVRPVSEEDDDGETPGQPAELRARVVKRSGEASLVELRPVTGRRHQLRAQLSAHGCPIVGDRMYGARLPFSEGIALHARELLFDHPATGRPCRLVAEFPASWQPRFASLVAAVPPAER